MEIKVEVKGASLDDVVAVAYDAIEETVTATTLGDVIVQALLDRLAADERWGDLAARFAAKADEWLEASAPVFIEELVAREVARQLGQVDRQAMTRGKPSTKAEAVVATEVTTQLREQFKPVVEQALAGLTRDLDAASAEAASAFRRGLGLPSRD